jgi:hypothetical protein
VFSHSFQEIIFSPTTGCLALYSSMRSLSIRTMQTPKQLKPQTFISITFLPCFYNDYITSRLTCQVFFYKRVVLFLWQDASFHWTLFKGVPTVPCSPPLLYLNYITDGRTCQVFFQKKIKFFFCPPFRAYQGRVHGSWTLLNFFHGTVCIKILLAWVVGEQLKKGGVHAWRTPLCYYSHQTN